LKGNVYVFRTAKVSRFNFITALIRTVGYTLGFSELMQGLPFLGTELGQLAPSTITVFLFSFTAADKKTCVAKEFVFPRR